MYCWNIVLLIVEGNFLIPVGKVLYSYGFVVAEKSRKFGSAYHELFSVFSSYVAVCLYLLLLLFDFSALYWISALKLQIHSISKSSQINVTSMTKTQTQIWEEFNAGVSFYVLF